MRTESHCYTDLWELMMTHDINVTFWLAVTSLPPAPDPEPPDVCMAADEFMLWSLLINPLSFFVSVPEWDSQHLRLLHSLYSRSPSVRVSGGQAEGEQLIPEWWRKLPFISKLLLCLSLNQAWANLKLPWCDMTVCDWRDDCFIVHWTIKIEHHISESHWSEMSDPFITATGQRKNC